MTRQPWGVAAGLNAVGLVLLVVAGGSLAAMPMARDATGAPEASPYPSGTRYPASTRLTPVARPPVPRPQYRVPTRDPAFGTWLVRVSDQQAFGTKKQWLRNTYAKSQAWNSDGTVLLLGYDGAGILLDGTTYRDLGVRMPDSATGVWSNTDPDVFFNVRGNALLSYSVASGTSTVLHAFDAFESVSIGRGEGSPSNDDRTLVLIGEAGASTTVLTYDPLSDDVVAELPLGGVGDMLDWAAPSQSGAYVVLHWSGSGAGPNRGVQLYDRQLRPLRHLESYSEHADFGIDPAGNEVYVTFDYVSGTEANELRVMAIRLRDGRSHVVIRTPWTGTHVSCRNLDRPGWCYVSDANASTDQRDDAGYDEVFGVLLDGSGVVQRFAHAQQPPEGDYGGHAMAVPSRDGGRVLFASSWRGDAQAPVYAYVAGAARPPLPLQVVGPSPLPRGGPARKDALSR